MSVTVAQTGIDLFGVGIEALRLSDTTNAGTLIITDMVSTSTKNANILGKVRINIVHRLNGGANLNSKVFNFDWTAPAAGSGDVKFYFAGIASDSSGDESGDYVYTGSQLFTEAGCQAPAQPSSINGNTTNCDGAQTTYTVPAVSGATSYIWTLPNGWTGTSTTNSINVQTNTTSGNISVAAVNTCGNCPASYLFVNINAAPVVTATYLNDTLYSSSPSLNNQWYFNSAPISGATGSIYVPTQNGNYSVEVTDPLTNCSGSSNIVNVINVGISIVSLENQMQIFPNPAREKVMLQIPEILLYSEISVYNMTGKIVMLKQLNELNNSIDISKLAEGTYTIIAQNDKARSINRILISRN
jgi:hypothetical protein